MQLHKEIANKDDNNLFVDTLLLKKISLGVSIPKENCRVLTVDIREYCSNTILVATGYL